MIKKGWKNTLLFWMLFVVSVFAEIASGQDAILQLGRQMANIREMLETYIMLGAKIEFDAPKERLKKLMQEYEQTLEDIAKQYPDPAILKKVEKSRKDWQPVKKELLDAFDKTNHEKMRKEAADIHDRIGMLVDDLDEMKRWVLEKKQVKQGKELNAALEIGSASQSLSAHYMMKMWGVPDPAIQKHWDDAVRRYEEGLAILEASSYAKDSAFKKLLRGLKKDLLYFKTVITFEDEYVPVLVYEKADDALKRANKMVEMILQGQ